MVKNHVKVVEPINYTGGLWRVVREKEKRYMKYKKENNALKQKSK